MSEVNFFWLFFSQSSCHDKVLLTCKSFFAQFVVKLETACCISRPMFSQSMSGTPNKASVFERVDVFAKNEEEITRRKLTQSTRNDGAAKPPHISDRPSYCCTPSKSCSFFHYKVSNIFLLMMQWIDCACEA